MSEVRWVIQSNLGSSGEIKRLFQACDALGVEALPVEVVPFSDELPNVPTDKPAIFYGSARFVANAVVAGKWHPCAYFDDSIFRFSHWRENYRGYLLNDDAVILSMEEFAQAHTWENSEMLFIRPDRDLKEFGGTLMTFQDYKTWYDRIAALGSEAEIGANTKLVVATPKNLGHEWRLFMVDGKYCSGSHYRSYGTLEVHSEVPSEVIAFAHDTSRVWQPDQVYAVDVGEVEGKLLVVEINGFNSTGFYDSDIQSIVSAVSELVVDG